MKNEVKKWLVSGTVLLFLTGCSTGKSASTETEEKQTTEPINLMSATELTSLDPAAMLDFPDAIIQTAAFEGLYELDEQDTLVPAAAKDLPEISADGKTYTFTLREDGKWSNGDPVTAHDFEYAWKRLVDPKNGFVYSFLLSDTVENAEAITTGEKSVDELGVKALDDYTLEVQLKNPAPYFTSLMVFPVFFPQNQQVVEEFGEAYGTDSEKIAYNGAYTVHNWKQADMNWDLAKSETYWDKENVKSDNFHFEVVKEASTAVNLFEAGQLDVATVKGEMAKQTQSNPLFNSYPTATMNYIRLNQIRNGKDTPLKNENLRKALALGIDKENLVNNIIADGSKPLYGAITENFVSNPETGADFREDAGDLMVYDKEMALSYWKKAQSELGESIIVELLTTDDGGYKKMGESLQWNLEDTFPGLTIKLTSMPTETALNLSAESDYDMFLIYWTPDYQDAISTLKTMYSGNNRHYNNPTFDQLIDDASDKYATDLPKRWEALIAAEKELMENTAGMIAISQNQESVLKNDAIEGLSYHTFAAPLTLKNIEKK